MKKLSDRDFDKIDRLPLYISVEYFLMNRLKTAKYTIQSDFQGNLHYEYKENGDTHLKPLGITIPELKAVPTFYTEPGLHGSVHNEIEPPRRVDKSKFKSEFGGDNG